MGESKQEKHESRWSQLLLELLTRISLHVFKKGDARDVAVIPTVCKSWNDLFDINYATTFIRTSLPDPPLNLLAPQYPCFMTLRGSLCKFYHPSHTFTMVLPELSGFYIRFSKFGWLLLSSITRSDDCSYTYFFFNPFTRQKIDLPVCNKKFFSMCFSDPPTSSNCVVFGLAATEFGFTKLGEENWGIHGSIKFDEFTPCSHLIICRNCFYAIGDEGKILVLDLKRKSLYFLRNPLHKDSSSMPNIKTGYLVEDGQKLLVVMVSYEEEHIYIRRMTPTKRDWLPVETLRNKMLFISQTSSMLKPAPVKAASNKIYFPKIFNNDTFIPYCLATKKYVSFLGDYASKGPWNADANVKQWPINSTWIDTMPYACNQ